MERAGGLVTLGNTGGSVLPKLRDTKLVDEKCSRRTAISEKPRHREDGEAQVGQVERRLRECCYEC
jgi:hypothetical protein